MLDRKMLTFKKKNKQKNKKKLLIEECKSIRLGVTICHRNNQPYGQYPSEFIPYILYIAQPKHMVFKNLSMRTVLPCKVLNPPSPTLHFQKISDKFKPQIITEFFRPTNEQFFKHWSY